MSFDINIMVLGRNENINVPFTKKVTVVNEYMNGFGRYYNMYEFMTMQNGTWCSIIKDLDAQKGAFGICDGYFEMREDMIKYPYWVNNEDTLYDLVPIKIFDEYFEEVKNILYYLADKSPLRKIMFLARMQGTDEEIVCGTINLDKFIDMIIKKQVLFNVCYILKK